MGSDTNNENFLYKEVLTERRHIKWVLVKKIYCTKDWYDFMRKTLQFAQLWCQKMEKLNYFCWRRKLVFCSSCFFALLSSFIPCFPILSSLLRSQFSMCVPHSISSRQLSQGDPGGLLTPAPPYTHVRTHTHTQMCALNVYVCLTGIVQIRPHVERLIHIHWVCEPPSSVVHCSFFVDKEHMDTKLLGGKIS